MLPVICYLLVLMLPVTAALDVDGAARVRWVQAGYLCACVGWLLWVWREGTKARRDEGTEGKQKGIEGSGDRRSEENANNRRHGTAAEARSPSPSLGVRGVRESATGVVIGVGVLLRLAMLPAAVSDDVYRYVWEGEVRAAGFNPYLLAPDDPKLDAVESAYRERVNHPYHKAIYAPAAEGVFTLVAMVYPHPLGMKLVFVAADVATLFVLAVWLRGRGTEARRHKGTEGGDRGVLVGVYALCPIVLLGIAGEAHLDGLLMLGLAVMLAAVDGRRGEAPGAGQAFTGGLGLGLAAGVKWFPVLLLPWLAARAWAGRDWRAAGAGVLGFLTVIVVPAFFYLEGGVTPLLDPLRNFHDAFRQLDAARQVLGLWLSAEQVRLVAMGTVAAIAVAVALQRARGDVALLWALGGLILLSPTVHAWYLCWIVPALCMRMRWAWAALVVLIVLAYEGAYAFEATGTWSMPAWVTGAIFGPFYVLLVLELGGRYVLRKHSCSGNGPGGRSVS